MKPRQNTIDLFSTFLRFEADCFSNWAIDAKLRRSMKACLAEFPESNTSEQFWATYWHQR
ncbi:MAG: group 3/4 sigma-70 RNA polymerase sigma factor, partial [Leptolyngbya sp. ERB_1_2]